jgi:hypothetical protein
MGDRLNNIKDDDKLTEGESKALNIFRSAVLDFKGDNSPNPLLFKPISEPMFKNLVQKKVP